MKSFNNFVNEMIDKKVGDDFKEAFGSQLDDFIKKYPDQKKLFKELTKMLEDELKLTKQEAGEVANMLIKK